MQADWKIHFLHKLGLCRVNPDIILCLTLIFVTAWPLGTALPLFSREQSLRCRCDINSTGSDHSTPKEHINLKLTHNELPQPHYPQPCLHDVTPSARTLSLTSKCFQPVNKIRGLQWLRSVFIKRISSTHRYCEKRNTVISGEFTHLSALFSSDELG